MVPRSWLFVPGDSERKLAKGIETGADAIIVDLEDSVALDGKDAARGLAHEWLAAHRSGIAAGRATGRWVRINALDTGLWRDDLAAVMGAAPDGIMMPKALGPMQVQQLAAELYELEGRHGIPSGTTRILPLVSETAGSALTIGSYADASLPRLAGLTWGAEDLSAAIGASRKHDADGNWTDTFRLVRSMTLLAAHALDVPAIDTLHADFRDQGGLERVAAASRADGFSGMLAIHPGQVAAINAAFAPSEAELADARAVIAAFAAQPGAGVVSLNGRMLDQPHLKLARRLLGQPQTR
ncbi:HpcH/HpaI aldolase/citrate lyase family protein [Novosphingobium tardum]|uniref:HpcH/HpaI aldolase/citrate lyase family protein n=1 Tax=Novosphingobium tardum TaxID=1538021 RepID=A0ABV8RL16_9SPHN